MAAIEVSPRPIAASIGLLFGGLWSFLGARGLPHPLQLPLMGLGALITVALIAALWKRRDLIRPSAHLFRRRGYLIAVALEIVAIFAASDLLARHGLKSYFVQAVGVIVGLHFVGLWQATRSSQFLWIAGCMSLLSALAAFLPDSVSGFDPRDVVTGFGEAMVLWIGAGRTWTPTDLPDRRHN